jgi:hypothetical protein
VHHNHGIPVFFVLRDLIFHEHVIDRNVPGNIPRRILFRSGVGITELDRAANKKTSLLGEDERLRLLALGCMLSDCCWRNTEDKRDHRPPDCGPH